MRRLRARLVILAVVLVALPLVIIAFWGDRSRRPASSSVQRPKGTNSAVSDNVSAPQGIRKTGAPPAPGVSSAPPPLNAENLANTKWMMEVEGVGAVTLELLPDGSALVESAEVPLGVKGTWSVSGKTLTLSVMGKRITGQLVGNQLMARGKPVTRVQ